MLIDVLLAIGVGLVTIYMAYLGVHVTLHPAEEPHLKLRYKVGFGLCAVIAVVLIGIQTWRNSETQSFLRDQVTDFSKQVSDLKRSIVHGHLRIEIATVAVDDANTIKFPFDPFKTGKRAMFNVTYKNSGPGNIVRVRPAGAVILADKKPDLDEAFITLESAFKAGQAGDELVPQQGKFMSPESRVLTVTDEQNIKSGKMLIYVVGIIKFSDPSGDFQQEFCKWLQPPGTSPVWHGCGRHESERQLTTMRLD